MGCGAGALYVGVTIIGWGIGAGAYEGVAITGCVGAGAEYAAGGDIKG